MIPLNLPAFEYKTRETDKGLYIFDEFRRKYVPLSPEEWVRQHFLHWLVTGKGYPGGLIAVEVSLKYLRMTKRADAIVYAPDGKALMLIECKAPHIQISQATFDQIARYNHGFKLRHMAVTNGMEHYFCQLAPNGTQWEFLSEFPDYRTLNHHP